VLSPRVQPHRKYHNLHHSSLPTNSCKRSKITRVADESFLTTEYLCSCCAANHT
jgi:hypothetical protein